MKTYYNPPAISTPNLGAITYIDLRLNFAFNLVFGNKGNEDLLLKLVNAILPELNIEAVSLSNQSQPGRRKSARSAVFDVSCITSDGQNIIIEMQYEHQDDFNDRMIFYSTFPIQNSLRKGDGTYRFMPTYVIGITDFILTGIKPNDRIINIYSSINEADKEIRLSENLHYVTVELPKLNKGLSELETPADMLFYAIRNICRMERMPDKYIGSGLEKLFELCKFAAMNEFVQKEYVQAFMADLDLRSKQRTSYNEGRKEGKEEKAREIAASLKAQGIPTEVISAATGLADEQIEAL